MVRRGLVPSRGRAQDEIDAGHVLVAGAPAERAARLVAPEEALHLVGPGARFVSRGGEKLDAALETFGVPVEGRTCLDAGASTGGFTDCLLQRGAATVVAVDVGRSLVHARIREDPRVRLVERMNVREMTLDDLGPLGVAAVTLLVADLSFISLRTVAPALVALVAPGADMVLLVKPQFEVGRAAVDRGRGVIRDPELRAQAVVDVADTYSGLGAAMIDSMESPITGAKGNVEYLAHFVRSSQF